MSLLQAIITGLVQGLTEFLPVSSSAHLVFADHFLHTRLSEGETVSFGVLLHLGTLLAVLIYFRRDIRDLLVGGVHLVRNPRRAWRENAFSRLFALLILGTVPAAILGVTLRPFFEAAFQNVPGTAALLIGTAIMLFWITYRRTGERQMESANWKDLLIIGSFQALAILPGISRSGSTITGGLLLGFNRDAAPRLSFLLSVPIILAGGLFDALDTLETGFSVPLGILAAGFVASAISGYLAIVWLLAVVRRSRLDRFGYYCAAVGILVLAYWTFLVPKPAPGSIAGVVDMQPVMLNSENELGPIELGQALQLRLAIKPGLVPVDTVYAKLPAGEHQHHGQSHTQLFNRQAGTDTFISEYYIIRPLGDAYAPQPGGDVREVWVILRNRWGIENEVRLRVRVVPESLSRRSA
jgi:undecaprenyl-diphosphatase